MDPARTLPSPVIVALDVPSRARARDLVTRLKGLPGMFKIGLELFVAEGPAVVRDVVGAGERVFLDMKLHDIPNTVSRAAAEAADLGVSMLTIHASGGPAMIETVRQTVERSFGSERPAVVAVTVLTSLDESSLRQTGVGGTVEQQVLRLAGLAADSGADGIVCSPHELSSVRQRFGNALALVTPGVRMPSQSADDQKRVATPRQALDSGADWLVVGRFVNRAPDPRAALTEVLESLSSGAPSAPGSPSQ